MMKKMNKPTPEEKDAIYYALAEHWIEDMQEMLADIPEGR